jgi:general secretion pathway protein G
MTLLFANSPRSIARARGFTLLELLVVMVILGLLASYIGPKYFGQIGKSEITVARTQMQALDKALDLFRTDMGRLPTAEEGLNALVTPPANGANRWHGPYLKQAAVPLDPWGRPYVYRVPGLQSDFQILSYGRSGTPGGTGEDATISIP